MGKILIVNASPRAPRSNSKEYARQLMGYSRRQTEYEEVRKSNHLQLCRKAEQASDLVLVFPLYVDGIPVTLLNFLKTLEEHLPSNKPTVSVVVNCGFLEPHQNDVAVEMVRLFCRQTGCPFGSSLEIGSGEAILKTPFRVFLRAKMRRFAASLEKRQYEQLQVTMPLSKRMFLRASSAYWEAYGKQNGVSREEMMTMRIEA